MVGLIYDDVFRLIAWHLNLLDADCSFTICLLVCSGLLFNKTKQNKYSVFKIKIYHLKK